MQLGPYLTFPGTCADAFDFYAEVFGDEVETRQLVKDSPMAGELPEERKRRASIRRNLLFARPRHVPRPL